MEKRIEGFEDYAITDDGEVISYKSGSPYVMVLTYTKNGKPCYHSGSCVIEKI